MVGRRLRELRERLGLDQIDLGAVMDYGQSMISQIESGDKAPSAASLIEVAKEYGVSMQWLFGLTDEMTPSSEGGTTMKGKDDDASEESSERHADLTAEQVQANRDLIMSEPMLALRVRGGNLTIYDEADIADYIRKVRSGEVQHEGQGKS